jgi:hypothetical protein
MTKNILVALTSLVLFCAVLEGLAWLYGLCWNIDLTHSPEYFKDTDNHLQFDLLLGWSLKPYYTDESIQIDALGLRLSFDDIIDECEGKDLVLLLGDSMVFGLGTRQDHIFSEILNGQDGDYCFVNTGVEGYSTVQEFLTAQKYLTLFTPDKVVLFYTQENDSHWNNKGHEFIADLVSTRILHDPNHIR